MYDSVLLSDVCLSRIMCRVWGRKRQGWVMKELFKGARANITKHSSFRKLRQLQHGKPRQVLFNIEEWWQWITAWPLISFLTFGTAVDKTVFTQGPLLQSRLSSSTLPSSSADKHCVHSRPLTPVFVMLFVLIFLFYYFFFLLPSRPGLPDSLVRV